MNCSVDLCLVCLTNNENLKNILSRDSDGIAIEEKCRFILIERVNIKPEISYHVCLNCLSNLDYVYRFKQTCLANIDKLNNYVEILRNLHGRNKHFQVTLTDLQRLKENESANEILPRIEETRVKEEVPDNYDMQEEEVMHENDEFAGKEKPEDINNATDMQHRSISYEDRRTENFLKDVKKETEFIDINEKIDIKDEQLSESTDSDSEDNSSDKLQNEKANSPVTRYFKIVSTQEKRGIDFTVVPCQWEINGILFWPEHLTHSLMEKLRSNALSAPEEGWSKHPCVVKCSAISTFEDALQIEKQLSRCIDTAAEESLFLPMQTKKRFKKPIKQNEGSVIDRNDLFEEIVETSATDAAVVVPQLHQELNNRILNLRADESVDLNVLNEATPNIHEEIILMKNSFRNEFNTFKTEIKQEIKKDFLNINLNLDKIFRILSSKDQPRNEIMTSNPRSNLLEDVKFPLTTVEEISVLEEKIRNDEEFRTQLIEFLSHIGGRTGQEDGSKIAYKVADCVFKSEILEHYSWTGVSRGTFGEKKAFQMLEGILEVFFEVILLADNRHTKKKNCIIFKDGILKHAKKRTARKRPRPNAYNDTDVPVNIVDTEEYDEVNDE